MQSPLPNPTPTPNPNAFSLKDLRRVFIAGIFMLLVMGYVWYFISVPSDQVILIISAMVGAYMAMNIGANDVANNVGPAVGSKVLTLTSALVIAAICEAAGAIIAGGEVVGTIRSGIIDATLVPNADSFVWLMLGALLAAAIWLNLATAVGAPVSTTHSIVGAVMGSGIAAAGLGAVNWGVLVNIAGSWVISPLLGGVFAALFLYLLKYWITYKQDKANAAKNYIPGIIAFMTWVFSTYILLKGLKNLVKINMPIAAGIGFVVAVLVFFFLRHRFTRPGNVIDNSKEGVNKLFTIPLIFAAGLLSFAHGSNDVANAIGPLAAIIDTIQNAAQATKTAAIPLWVMVVGAFGISLGLALFGPKLIRTVGTEITELDQMRAFCIALSAAVTVIVASQFGLPVSSTHIAVGGVFGVGFLREYLKTNYERMLEEIREHYPEGSSRAEIDSFIAVFENASLQERGDMLKRLKESHKIKGENVLISKDERKKINKVYKQELVKRSLVIRIAAAWLITVPASALLAAMMYFMLRGIMLP
jgi:PiT family inorganic phosphate transporter